MPFTIMDKINLKNKIKKDRVPLQVQRSGGRVFISAFHTGSITLEAALVVPIFLFAIISMIYFLVVIYIHINIQMAVDQVADSLTTKMYAVQTLSDSISKSNTDSDIEELVKKGVTAAWLYEQTVNKIGSTRLNNTYIVNGALGLNFTDSVIDMDSGIGDIIVKYKIRIPFMPKAIKSMSFTQRCRFRFWTGVSLVTENGEDVVYITTNGTVYHRDLTCYHLNLSITKTTYSQAKTLRNESGAKYSACAYCAHRQLEGASIVYVTNDGTKYHTSLECGGLKRGIMTVDISEVGDMPPCSNCGN